MEKRIAAIAAQDTIIHGKNLNPVTPTTKFIRILPIRAITNAKLNAVPENSLYRSPISPSTIGNAAATPIPTINMLAAVIRKDVERKTVDIPIIISIMADISTG